MVYDEMGKILHVCGQGKVRIACIHFVFSYFDDFLFQRGLFIPYSNRHLISIRHRNSLKKKKNRKFVSFYIRVQ